MQFLSFNTGRIDQVMKRLEASGASVFVPRRRERDLTRADRIRAMHEGARPDLVIQLAGAGWGESGRLNAHPVRSSTTT